MWICVVPHREQTAKALRYGTHSQGISQFYLHTPRSSTGGMNHTCLFLRSRSWSSFTTIYHHYCASFATWVFTLSGKVS